MKKKTVKKTVKKAVKKTLRKFVKKAGAKALDVAEKLTASPGASVAKSAVGMPAPKFRVPATNDAEIALADFSGKRIVLYFYPKDNTPGCTVEGYDFKRLQSDFEREDTVIFGVSKDSLKSHENFKQKCGFPFELLVDQDEKLCRAFDVIQMKSLYGRKYLGIERSTFVIGSNGRVLREWRKVKVSGHAEEVLEFVRTLS